MPTTKELNRLIKQMPVREWVDAMEGTGKAVWSSDMRKHGWPHMLGPLMSYSSDARRNIAESLDEICGGRNQWALVGSYYFFTTDEQAIKVKLTLNLVDYGD